MIDANTLNDLRQIVNRRVANDGTGVQSPLTCAEVLMLIDQAGEAVKLQAFKAYVHKRLDDMGVAADPPSAHRAEGCRIGGRLDLVRDALRLAFENDGRR